MTERQPPTDHSAANLSDPDILDCTNPYEPTDDAFPAGIDPEPDPPQHWDFPQP
jgi:hypothetical protein